MKAIIQKLRLSDDLSWSNPSIEMFEASIRALALSRDDTDEVIDNTIPDAKFIATAGDEISEFIEITKYKSVKRDIEEEQEDDKGYQKKTNDIEGETSKKKAKDFDASILEDETIRERIENAQMSKYTVAQLKMILKNANVKAQHAKKAELIAQVIEHYST